MTTQNSFWLEVWIKVAVTVLATVIISALTVMGSIALDLTTVKELRAWSCAHVRQLCDKATSSEPRAIARQSTQSEPQVSPQPQRPSAGLSTQVPPQPILRRQPSPVEPPVSPQQLQRPQISNGWSPTRGNINGDLVVGGDFVSTPHHSGRAGVYRPVGANLPITVSGNLTHESAEGGALNRYDATFLFGNDGSKGGGYGVAFARSDQRYANSAVTLVLNDVILASATPTFQFGASIRFTVALNPDGSIKVSATGDGQMWAHQFGPRAVALPSSNFAIVLGFPDGRASRITNATVRDIKIAGLQDVAQVQSALPLGSNQK